MNPTLKRFTPAIILVAVGVAAVLAYLALRPDGPGPGFAIGNGRIEATEVDVATKLPGRLEEVLVAEGEFVKAGQTLARPKAARKSPKAEGARVANAFLSDE